MKKILKEIEKKAEILLAKEESLKEFRQALDEAASSGENEISTQKRNVFSYRAIQGYVKRAKEDLKDLKMKYMEEFYDSSFFIVAHNESRKEIEKMMKLSKENFGCYSFMAEDYIKDLVETLPIGVWKGVRFSQTMLDTLWKAMSEMAEEYDFTVPYLYVESRHVRTINDLSDLSKVLFDIFVTQAGTEVLVRHAIFKLSKKALSDGFVGPVAPVILGTTNEELAKKLLFDLKNVLLKDAFDVKVEDVTLGALEKSFTEIKGKIKRK